MAAMREVPDHIMKPSYAATGKISIWHMMFPWRISIKTDAEIEAMKVSGRLAREVLDIAGQSVKPGITTNELDRIVHEETIKRNCYPSPLNYSKYPKSVCTSINEVVCHGIPGQTVLKEGDLINIDVTVFHNGFHGDCSETFCVGDVDDGGRRLIEVSYQCLVLAARFCKPGRYFKDIGAIIEEHAEKNGFTTVKRFCGHGIGRNFHENPQVLHYRNSAPNGIMRQGQTFTIEPMICEGSSKCLILPDEWTAVTVDGKRSAQFEHTFLMSDDGVIPLTGKLSSSKRQWFEELHEQFST